MKFIYRFRSEITFSLLALLFTGCALNRVNLTENGTVQVTTTVPPSLQISSSVYEEEDELLIFGTLRRTDLGVSIHGHLDIQLLSPAGAMISELTADLQKMPTRRHGSKPASFFIRLPGVPPKGSHVNISYDAGAHALSTESK